MFPSWRSLSAGKTRATYTYVHIIVIIIIIIIIIIIVHHHHTHRAASSSCVISSISSISSIIIIITSISIIGTRDLLANETKGPIPIDSRLVVIE